MAALTIAIIRGTVGLCIIAVAIAMLVFSLMGEGAGCLNGIIFAVLIVVYFIAQETVGSDAIDAFFGFETFDVICGFIVLAVGCLYFSMSRIVGVLSSIALGYTGLLITGFLAAEDVATLSSGILDLGIVIMLPIALPVVLLCALLYAILH